MKKEAIKEKYIWTFYECVKDTYENWGTDMTSYDNQIKRDFPNVYEALKRIYVTDTLMKKDLKSVNFKKRKFVYETISSLMPTKEILKFNIETTVKDEEYKNLNIQPFDKYVEIKKIDLLASLMLFTEEFVLKKVLKCFAFKTKNKSLVFSKYLTFKISKEKELTIIDIKIHGVIDIKYKVLTNQ